MTDPRIATAPNVRAVFQVAAGDADAEAGQARYDVALYDDWPTATYSGLDALWTDAQCDVVEASTFYGRERTIDTFDVGTATVLVKNPAGMWDYPNLNPVTPLVIRPGRQARVGVVVDDDPPDWLWHGWIDATRPTYLPTGDDVVEVACVCAKGEAGRADVPRTTVPVGAGDTVVERLEYLADVAMFPDHRRQFDPSTVQLVETQLGGRVGQLADDAAKSAGGDVYGDNHGHLVYRARDWQTSSADEPLDGVIGNRYGDGSGEVCPSEWEITFARSDFSTRINYARSGDDAAVIDDVENQVRYGVETWDMTSMETADDAMLTLLADRALRVRSFDLAPRVAAVRLNAARPGAVDLLRHASPFQPSRYACGLVQNGRTVFARTLYVTGVEHNITAGQWTARLALDDVTPWLTPANTRYDAARYDEDVYTRLA